MALGPKLQQRQSQSLVMTPQLQQAIKLLQLNNIELSAFIDEQLEKNPLLERGNTTDNRRDEGATSKEDLSTHGDLSLDAPSAEASTSLDAPDHAVDSEASVADRQSASQSDSLDRHRLGRDFSVGGGDDGFNPMDNQAKVTSLCDILTEQLGVSIHDEKDRMIGQYLIDQVDENGYFRGSPEDIAERLGVSVLRVKSVLTTLKSFEPTGVFAQSLAECLSMQLKEQKKLDDAMEIILENLEMVARHDLSKLAKLAQLSLERLKERLGVIRTLSPKPGLAYGGDMAAAVAPDVFIRETPQGGWTVELNTETLPRILVNNQYMAEVSSLKSDDATQSFISECHQNANWLVRSIDQRARTILKVASEIVKQQDEFFAFGLDHMRPLNLKTVADAIEMHESTVSRVTSNKFMSTPRGMFELKFFFSASIPSAGGGDSYSAEAVRHKIKILIGEEFDVKSVKSDDKLVSLLRAQGVDVARRTVAKYRESMGIPSSVERRRIMKARL
ncbi:MAG: RNA polymerase factor sigma-54 [Maricaulaceae bacterium]